MPYQYKREPLTGDEVNALCNACRTTQDKLVVFTLLDTGLRVAEFADLQRSNLDYQSHRLMIYGKGGPYGKRSKRRTLKLSPRLRTLLEPWLVANDAIGISVRTAQRILARVARRSKIARECTPHVLRHTFAVDALKKRVPLPMLMQWLGHENLQTTQAYLNLAPEDVIAAFEQHVFGEGSTAV